MNPVVVDIGPLTLHSYAVWILAGVLLALALIAWRAARHDPAMVGPWLDVGLAALVGGVAGARLLQMALVDADAKGMAWHGALLLGIPAAAGVAWLRHVDLRRWSDAAALGWPLVMAVVWRGCRNAGCGYGYEVATLADWPDWLAAELPDIYGLDAPRLDVQNGGVLWSAILFALVLILTWRNWLPGLRLWVTLGVGALGLALLGFFRADPAQTWADRRADQVMDLLVLLCCTLLGGLLALLDARRAAREEIDYENQAGPGPDRAEVGRQGGEPGAAPGTH